MLKNTASWFSMVGWFCLLGDGATGLMLIVNPLFTLEMMGVSQVPADPVFIRYIGVFVLCTGIFYAVPRCFADEQQRRASWKTVFTGTCILRVMVAGFVSCAWMLGTLDSGWMSVPVYDVSAALVQIIVLRRAAAV